MTRDLCIMACVFCRDPAFREWLSELSPPRVAFTEDMAKAFIVEACGVASRSDLDKNAAAAERFHNLVRLPFLAWKEERPRSEGLSVENAAAPLALGSANAGPSPGAHRSTVPDAAPVAHPGAGCVTTSRRHAFAFVNLKEEDAPC